MSNEPEVLNEPEPLNLVQFIAHYHCFCGLSKTSLYRFLFETYCRYPDPEPDPALESAEMKQAHMKALGLSSISPGAEFFLTATADLISNIAGLSVKLAIYPNGPPVDWSSLSSK